MYAKDKRHKNLVWRYKTWKCIGYGVFLISNFRFDFLKPVIRLKPEQRDEQRDKSLWMTKMKTDPITNHLRRTRAHEKHEGLTWPVEVQYHHLQFYTRAQGSLISNTGYEQILFKHAIKN